MTSSWAAVFVVSLFVVRALGYIKVHPRCSLSDDLFTMESAQVAYDKARFEVGLDHQKIPRVWHEVFNHQSSHCVLVETPTSCVGYRSIVKCGNEAIRASLINGTTACKQCSADTLECAAIGGIARERCLGRPVIYFTFVREPLSHYLSGYSEYMYREYIKHNRAFHRDRQYSEIRAGIKENDEPLAYVLEHIKGENWLFDEGVVRKHMSLMSGFLGHLLPGASRMLQFVGELSTSDSDWARLFALANLDKTPLEHQTLGRTFGFHESSLDPLGVRAELHNILAKNTSLRRGLCRLLERDYVCFQYDFDACLNGSALDRIS